MATQAEVEAVLKVKDRMSQSLKGIGKNVDAVQKKTKGLGKGVKEFSSGLTNAVPGMSKFASLLAGPAGIAIGVAGLAAAIGKVVKDTVALSEQMVDLSVKTGVSTDALQELKFAGDQVGVEFRSITDAVLRLGRRTAAELPETTKAVAALGLSLDEIIKAKPEEGFRLVLEQIAKIPNEAQQSAAAMAVFGDAGLQILPLLRTDLEGTIERFREMGGVISEDVLKSGKALGDQITDLSAKWTAIKGVISSLFIPVLLAVATFFTDTLPAAFNIFKGAFLIGLAETAKKLAGFLDVLALAPGSLGERMTELADKTRNAARDLQAMGEESVKAGLKVKEVNTAVSTAGETIDDFSLKAGEAALKTTEFTAAIDLDTQSLIEMGFQMSLLGEIQSRVMDDGVVDQAAFVIATTETGRVIGGFTERTMDAFQRMGVSTRAQLEATALQAEEDYATIAASGLATAEELERAFKKMEEARRLDSEATTETMLTQAEGLNLGAQQLFTVLGQKYKAAAIAGAIIATYQAIAKALASAPWPFNLVLAAGAAAAGFANVAKIRGSEPGFQKGTRDLDFQEFGSSTFAALHGREAVIPQGTGHILAAEIATALASKRGPERADTRPDGSNGPQMAREISAAIAAGFAGRGGGVQADITMIMDSEVVGKVLARRTGDGSWRVHPRGVRS